MTFKWDTLCNGIIFNGDCLEVMPELINQGIKIDAIITDVPYGTTACKWDTVIPFEPMWKCLNNLIKDNGAIVLFGQEPFSTHLRISNIDNWRYDYVWVKQKGTDFVNANKKPMKYHELIHVFYKRQPTFNVQYMPRKSQRVKQLQKNKYKGFRIYSEGMPCNPKNSFIDFNVYDPDKKRQGSVIYCPSVVSNSKEKQPHPTQKPITLMEYLVKTYTNENEVVLDFTRGSGTTCVACQNLNRNFIGIELDKGYYEIAKQRIKDLPI